MIHPGESDPQPDIISISYGMGPDDESAESFSDQEYAQLGQLFQDAANLSVTVLVSAGDSGGVRGEPEAGADELSLDGAVGDFVRGHVHREHPRDEL
jgi:hypothetical protein